MSWKSVVWSAAAVRTWPGLTLHYYRVLDDVSVSVSIKTLSLGDVTNLIVNFSDDPKMFFC